MNSHKMNDQKKKNMVFGGRKVIKAGRDWPWPHRCWSCSTKTRCPAQLQINPQHFSKNTFPPPYTDIVRVLSAHHIDNLTQFCLILIRHVCIFTAAHKEMHSSETTLLSCRNTNEFFREKKTSAVSV